VASALALAPPSSDLPRGGGVAPPQGAGVTPVRRRGHVLARGLRGRDRAPRATAGLDLAAMVKRGILRVLPPHLYAWAGGPCGLRASALALDYVAGAQSLDEIGGSSHAKGYPR
jgi:hypothetical protein